MAVSAASLAAQRAKQRLMGALQRTATLTMGDRWMQMQIRQKMMELEKRSEDRSYEIAQQGAEGTTHKMGALGMTIGGALGSVYGPIGTMAGGGIGQLLGTAGGAMMEAKQRGDIADEYGRSKQNFGNRLTSSIWRAPTAQEGVALGSSALSLAGPVGKGLGVGLSGGAQIAGVGQGRNQEIQAEVEAMTKKRAGLLEQQYDAEEVATVQQHEGPYGFERGYTAEDYYDPMEPGPMGDPDEYMSDYWSR